MAYWYNLTTERGAGNTPICLTDQAVGGLMMATGQVTDISLDSQLVSCRVCGGVKVFSEYYHAQVKADRTSGECKECTKERVRKNRSENAEYYRTYDQKRYQEDPRVKSRHKRYRDSAEGKEAFQRARTKWLSNNPEKRAAHVAFGNALRDGRVKQQSQCGLCGSSEDKLDAHHFDYGKPLDVTWLCRDCHVAFHNHHGPVGDHV